LGFVTIADENKTSAGVTVLKRKSAFVSVLLLLVGLSSHIVFLQSDAPQSVVIAGTIQSVLGCKEDWQPACETTELVYDEEDDLWRGTFELPAGEYEYKVALNGSWDVNYGAAGEPGGANIPLVLSEDSTVRFLFDNKSGYVTDSVNSIIANVPGSFQSEIGCAGDWMPECLRSWLQDMDGDGVYRFETGLIPAGDYEAKVAVNETWDVNYGADGEPGGANIPFTVPEGGAQITFNYNTSDNLLTIETGDLPEGVDAPAAEDTGGEIAQIDVVVPQSPTEEPPTSVTIAGTIQSVLGCESDWDPVCEVTFLTYDFEDDVWRGTFELPAGDYEYKAALNGTWDVSVGQNGDTQSGSANIALSLAEDTAVTFIYDHETGYVLDTVNQLLATAPGNYQDEIGCPGEWQPNCLRSLFMDIDGDGIYTYLALGIPAGDYEAKVALNETWDVNYGADGAPGGANIPFSVPDDNLLVVFTFDSTTNLMTIQATEIPEGMEVPDAPVQRGSFSSAKAYWVSEDTILWDARDAGEDTVYQLHSHFTGRLTLEPEGVTRGINYALTVDPEGADEAVLEKFPHLAGLTALKIADDTRARIPAMLRGQLAVSATAPDGTLLDATVLQTAGVIDDLYANDDALGIVWEGDNPTIRVWAPTAKNVTFHLFEDSSPDTQSSTFEMIRDDETGVWSVTGEADWRGKFYLFEVEVFVRSTGQVETNLVTDPYSVSLSTNSQRSQIVHLDDEELKPEGWDELAKPELNAPEDITIYELHIRDFSAADETVRPEYRGKYLAFTETEANGMQHLIALAQAGLTHLHLLPSFDIATINEVESEWVNPDPEELASFPADSDQQQALILPIRDQDGFNWGYDPYHYNVPEGSYATDPEGTTRIVEFRQMVQSLNQNGLRVVVDVVYNHTSSAGQAERSVLDKIVPDYYYRLDQNGNITTSTCCPNTATEHDMMEKLMVDSVVLWATEYKVDGFRFDLMGHHMKRNMLKVRAALDALTLEEHGVDGKSIYVYGEGWNFGEVQDNARGENATQLNLAGTGIGTFSDRLRDAARGGSPFGGLQEQGFINGAYVNPNGILPVNEDLDRMLLFTDLIRVGLAGNLATFEFEDRTGEIVSGADVPYNGQPGGYTLDPQEHIVYVDKHDNETLFDIIQYKAPLETSMANRVRMQNFGLSIVTLSQGVPFYQAGSDMLRSKSLDRNSYNSGDWFNALDFSYETNNWGKGLPMSPDNQGNYPIMQPLLANPDLMPTKDDILTNAAYFREILQVRYSSPLFRLQTGEQVQEMLTFQNTGAEQTPGLIVMTLTDTQNLDENYALIVVLFNAQPDEITFDYADLSGETVELHPVLADGSDEVVKGSSFDSETGAFTVPGITTAVFVIRDTEG
jgi:pullulanase